MQVTFGCTTTPQNPALKFGQMQPEKVDATTLALPVEDVQDTVETTDAQQEGDVPGLTYGENMKIGLKIYRNNVSDAAKKAGTTVKKQLTDIKDGTKGLARAIVPDKLLNAVSAHQEKVKENREKALAEMAAKKERWAEMDAKQAEVAKEQAKNAPAAPKPKTLKEVQTELADDIQALADQGVTFEVTRKPNGKYTVKTNFETKHRAIFPSYAKAKTAEEAYEKALKAANKRLPGVQASDKPGTSAGEIMNERAGKFPLAQLFKAISDALNTDPATGRVVK